MLKPIKYSIKKSNISLYSLPFIYVDIYVYIDDDSCDDVDDDNNDDDYDNYCYDNVDNDVDFEDDDL